MTIFPDEIFEKPWNDLRFNGKMWYKQPSINKIFVEYITMLPSIFASGSRSMWYPEMIVLSIF